MSAVLEAKLDTLISMVAAIQMQLSAAPAPANGKTEKWGHGGGYADEAFLDGKFGNPTVFKSDPREWTGDTQVGKQASEVPPGYGRLYADMCDRFGDMAKRDSKVDKNGKPIAWRKYQEAGCFRAWAKRNEVKAKDNADELPF